MKRGFIKLIVLVSTIIVLGNCKKIGKTYDAYFYTDIQSSSGQLSMYLDDKFKGKVPVFKTTLSTKNDTIKDQALHLKLRTGSYKISVRDDQGNIKCAGKLVFRFNRFNGATNPGVLEHAMYDGIIVTRIFFE